MGCAAGHGVDVHRFHCVRKLGSISTERIQSVRSLHFSILFTGPDAVHSGFHLVARAVDIVGARGVPFDVLLRPQGIL